MTIYTVIPFFSDGIEIFQNDIKSFKSFAAAQLYAWNEIDGKRYEIVENNLID
jgi:hypothetical protein